MQIVRTPSSLRESVAALKASGKRVALVPTMGALHDGHISLIAEARKHADAVIATIFVNPTQFGPNEDFSQYPRTETEDITKLAAVNTDLVYIPSAEDMYPPGSITQVVLPRISDELCGAFRPGHFTGVATVVAKLLLQAQPDVAVFGEKDYQQLHIIKTMVRDLCIPVQILGAPILREADGLAMSSRNRYLNEAERAIAPALHRILQQVAGDLTQLPNAGSMLIKAGFTKVDYVVLRDAETLKSPMEGRSTRLLAAVRLGKTRLIDNLAIP